MSRWCKHILGEYVEELASNLQKWIWCEVEIHEVEGGYTVRLLANAAALRELYGTKVFPDDVFDLCTGPTVRPSKDSLRCLVYKVLYRSLFLLDEHPVITRMWTFGEGLFALLRMRLIEVPIAVVGQVFGTQLRKQNQARLTAFRQWYASMERLILCSGKY